MTQLWYGEKQPLTTLEIALFYAQVADAFQATLERHNILVTIHADHWQLAFPEGTIWQPEYPTVISDRYRVILPDTFTLHTVITRTAKYHSASIPEKYLPDEVKQQLSIIQKMRQASISQKRRAQWS